MKIIILSNFSMFKKKVNIGESKKKKGGGHEFLHIFFYNDTITKNKSYYFCCIIQLLLLYSNFKVFEFLKIQHRNIFFNQY